MKKKEIRPLLKLMQEIQEIRYKLLYQMLDQEHLYQALDGVLGVLIEQSDRYRNRDFGDKFYNAVDAVAGARESSRATNYSVVSNSGIESKLKEALEEIVKIKASDYVIGLLFKISSLSHVQVRKIIETADNRLHSYLNEKGSLDFDKLLNADESILVELGQEIDAGAGS